MKIAVAVVVATCLAGCATAGATRYGPNRAGGRADLRVHPGICADSASKDGLVRACAMIGAPGTLSDDGRTPFLITQINGLTFEDANPGNWQLTIFRPDGSEAVKTMLKPKVPDVGVCTEYGCVKTGFNAMRAPVDWTPGLYRLRYVCSFDTSKSAEMTIAVR